MHHVTIEWSEKFLNHGCAVAIKAVTPLRLTIANHQYFLPICVFSFINEKKGYFEAGH